MSAIGHFSPTKSERRTAVDEINKDVKILQVYCFPVELATELWERDTRLEGRGGQLG